uniref:Uncharacterized protein n=1 Tax=Arundo donax TaxID=35708 RepID=A0A0A9DPN2_ARUDO
MTFLILALDEKLQLLETRTCGISNKEKSYSLKGKRTTDVMFHLSGRPNPLFFLQYQMAGNSPQWTKSWMVSQHMNYKLALVQLRYFAFLDIVV